jgi:hypothetical protein
MAAVHPSPGGIGAEAITEAALAADEGMCYLAAISFLMRRTIAHPDPSGAPSDPA